MVSYCENLKKNYEENWNILVSLGKEINRDLISSGERISINYTIKIKIFKIKNLKFEN
jgi:hypothetical protein